MYRIWAWFSRIESFFTGGGYIWRYLGGAIFAMLLLLVWLSLGK